VSEGPAGVDVQGASAEPASVLALPQALRRPAPAPRSVSALGRPVPGETAKADFVGRVGEDRVDRRGLQTPESLDAVPFGTPAAHVR
jgi:hypothetical protein